MRKGLRDDGNLCMIFFSCADAGAYCAQTALRIVRAA